MLQMLTYVIDNIFYMYDNNTSLKDSCKHYVQIQAEGTLDQVVQARMEGKANVQDLLTEYCKMKKPLLRGFLLLVEINQRLFSAQVRANHATARHCVAVDGYLLGRRVVCQPEHPLLEQPIGTRRQVNRPER